MRSLYSTVGTSAAHHKINRTLKTRQSRFFPSHPGAGLNDKTCIYNNLCITLNTRKQSPTAVKRRFCIAASWKPRPEVIREKRAPSKPIATYNQTRLRIQFPPLPYPGGAVRVIYHSLPTALSALCSALSSPFLSGYHCCCFLLFLWDKPIPFRNFVSLIPSWCLLCWPRLPPQTFLHGTPS